MVEFVLRMLATLTQVAAIDATTLALLVGLAGIATVAVILVARAIVASITASVAIPADRSRRDLVDLLPRSIDSDPDAAGHVRSRAPGVRLTAAGR